MAAQGGGVASQPPSFRVGVDVVSMNVTVTDATRQFVTGLDGQDFRVFEDGRPQQIAVFQKNSLPIALALLIDSSASMDMAMTMAQEAAVGFVRALAPVDVASVVDFDSRVQIRQAFTADREALEKAIRQTDAGGSTSLYNAVYIALKELNKTAQDGTQVEPRRRAMVILSDGEDTSSLVGPDEILDLAARSDTAIYAIALGSPDATTGSRQARDAQFVLRRLVQQTGGRVFVVSDVKELRGVYAEIKAELSNQYFLAYESNNPSRDGRFRRIAVQVERNGATARARPGYYAPSR